MGKFAMELACASWSESSTGGTGDKQLALNGDSIASRRPGKEWIASSRVLLAMTVKIAKPENDVVRRSGVQKTARRANHVKLLRKNILMFRRRFILRISEISLDGTNSRDYIDPVP